MDSADIEVLKAAVGWLEAGHRVALVTVVATWGSAPRPAGAWLGMRDDGLLVGSVSGGCIEDDLVGRMRDGEFRGSKPQVVTYGVTKDEARRFGLPCGGTLRLVVEPAPDTATLRDLRARIEGGELAARTVDLASGAVTLAAAQRGDVLRFDGGRMTNVHGPRLRLLVIGAGQVSFYLAQMAQALDYQVIVCDPREEYAAAWQVPGAQLVTTMPDDTVLALKLDGHSAVVALTHDPKLDDMALLEALKSPAFYVGALGSRANDARRRERLGQFDLTPEQIARLHGPVGLRIGSRTPAEIAVSILAEMTAVRNTVALPAVEAATA